jgi:hypothetical protein
LRISHSNLEYNMFNSNSRPHTSTSPWHTATSTSRHNRFNDWAHDDDVENTNDQIGASNNQTPPTHQVPLTPTNTFHTPAHQTPPRHRSSLFNTPTPSFPPPTPSFPPPTPSFPPPTPSIPPPPPTTNSLFSWSLGDDSLTSNLFPPLNTPSEQPVTEELPKEYTVTDSLYNRNYYRGVIDTQKTTHDTLGKIEYITIRDVFEYVTLGGGVCDSYLDQITKLVVKEIPNHVTIDIQETSFNGNAYICTTPVFSFEHYGLIARICLDWAISNPEKLAPS